MKKFEIDLKNININEIRDDVNLFIFNNNLGGMEAMKQTNEILEALKDVKFKVTLS